MPNTSKIIPLCMYLFQHIGSGHCSMKSWLVQGFTIIPVALGMNAVLWSHRIRTTSLFSLRKYSLPNNFQRHTIHHHSLKTSQKNTSQPKLQSHVILLFAPTRGAPWSGFELIEFIRNSTNHQPPGLKTKVSSKLSVGKPCAKRQRKRLTKLH